MKHILQLFTFLAVGSLSLFAEDKQKPIKALLITAGAVTIMCSKARR